SSGRAHRHTKRFQSRRRPCSSLLVAQQLGIDPAGSTVIPYHRNVIVLDASQVCACFDLSTGRNDHASASKSISRDPHSRQEHASFASGYGFSGWHAHCSMTMRRMSYGPEQPTPGLPNTALPLVSCWNDARIAESNTDITSLCVSMITPD